MNSRDLKTLQNIIKKATEKNQLYLVMNEIVKVYEQRLHFLTRLACPLNADRVREIMGPVVDARDHLFLRDQ
jgi:hypothetical protein